MVDLMPAGRTDGVILNAGCGAGRTTLALARALKFSRFISFDAFDSEYIEGGGRLLYEQNIRLAGLVERAQVKQGSLLKLPFDNETFDAAISAHAMDHLGQMKKQGLGEIVRVLKPGGRFPLVLWAPSWAMVAVLGILALFLTSRATWKRMAADVGFVIMDEGMFNGVWFLVLKKPEA
jgi:ubiquinone/menaquinone biosynthesis C-methylase UbiE